MNHLILACDNVAVIPNPLMVTSPCVHHTEYTWSLGCFTVIVVCQIFITSKCYTWSLRCCTVTVVCQIFIPSNVYLVFQVLYSNCGTQFFHTFKMLYFVFKVLYSNCGTQICIPSKCCSWSRHLSNFIFKILRSHKQKFMGLQLVTEKFVYSNFQMMQSSQLL